MGPATLDRAGFGFGDSLRLGDVRKLYASEVVSGAGDGVFWVALVVYLSQQPQFGLWLTLAVIARLAPRALLSLPAGSLVDRVSVRPLLISIDFGRAAIMAGLAFFVAADGPPGLALLAVIVSYAIAAPSRPALSAVVLVVAGEGHLAVANAVLSTIRQIMTFLGPMLGTVVVLWSPAAGFALNAVTFAVSGLIIATVSGIPRGPFAPSATGTSARRLGVVGSFADGLSAVATIPAMPALVSLIAVMYFVRGSEMVLHVFVVRDQLDADVGAIGLLGGAIGLGALLAMPIASRAASSDRPARAILVSIACTALPTAALALIERTLWACAVLVVVGAGMVVFEVVTVVMLQRVAPADSLGRVFGAVNGAANAGKLVGALAAPGLVAAVGLPWSLVVVALVLVAGGAFSVQPLTELGRLASIRRRSLAPRVAELAKLGIFEGASQASLERIAAEIQERKVGAGTVVLAEGDVPDDLYVCLAGRLDVSVGDRHLDSLGVDDWFGEIGLLEQRPRTATVTATEDCRLWRIPGETFLSVLEDAGAPPSALVDGMADRLAAHR
jgi:MFS family permease